MSHAKHYLSAIDGNTPRTGDIDSYRDLMQTSKGRRYLKRCAYHRTLVIRQASGDDGNAKRYDRGTEVLPELATTVRRHTQATKTLGKAKSRTGQAKA